MRAVRPRGRILLALAAAAAVVLSGCGSDDDADSGPDVAATGSAAPAASGSATPSPTTGAVSSVGGVFAGTTPCDGVTRPLPQIPAKAECELAIWRLDLAGDRSFTLDASYGMSQPNTTGIRDGGTKIAMTGSWGEQDGIVRLESADPALSVSFLRVGRDLLHLLDAEGRLVGGNGGWSYTLNQTGGADPAGSTPVVTASYAEPGTPGGGVFEGRTPCTDEVKPFTENLVPGCTKLKWRLTFRQDAAGEPAGYVSGVVGRADSRQGTWRIRHGIPGHPDAVVYRLRPDGGTGELRLLLLGGRHLFMLDENLDLLVGDRLWSYTLSRTD